MQPVVERYVGGLVPAVAEVGTFPQGGPNVRRLRAVDGSSTVLKWYRAAERPCRDLAEAAERARRLHAAGWPLPRILGVEEFDGLVFAREEFLPGAHPGDLSAEVVRTMIGLSRAGRGAAPGEGGGWWEAFARDLREGGRKVDPSVLRRDAYAASVLDRARAAFAQPPAPGREFGDLVHGDFSPGNVLVADGRLVGVVDWEGAAAGDAAFDLAALEWDLELWGRSVRGMLPAVRAELGALAPAPLPDAYRLYLSCCNLSWSLGTPEERDVVPAARRLVG